MSELMRFLACLIGKMIILVGRFYYFLSLIIIQKLFGFVNYVFEKLFKNLRLECKIKQLSPAERKEILEKSPIIAVAFQGEGFHVFRKDDPDYYTSYITSIGEMSNEEAEDWIIKQYFLDLE